MRLELKNVTKEYGKKVVIDNMNVRFEPGLYGFLGPNGAGKSTTIRMLCTVERPDAGEILINGRDIYEMGANYRAGIGYVPQKAGYYPDYTAYKFLQYMAGLKDVKNADDMIEKCLKMVNLWDVKDKKIKSFSGGMKQRLSVSQALLNNPAILILDEPTVGLDPDERMTLKAFLARWAQKRIIILATHIVSDVEDIADKVIILNQGVIRLNRSMEDALAVMNGRVWQCELHSDEEINQIKNQYKVSRVQKQKDGFSLRVISDKQPRDGAQQVDGNLEELYMQLMNKKIENG